MTPDKRIPITTLAQVDQLDLDDLYEGYRDGLAGDPEPGGNRSVAYWHGWRNGRVDGRHTEPDAAMRLLAADHQRRVGSLVDGVEHKAMPEERA